MRYQITLKDQLKTLSQDHPSIAAAYHNTATVYVGSTMIEDALEFAEKPVEQILKILPEWDPNSIRRTLLLSTSSSKRFA